MRGSQNRQTTATRAATYRRISDDREGQELGVTRQDEDLTGLAGQRGYQVVASYADNDVGASTRSRKPRPGYAKMIADAKAGHFTVILAYTAGRLTRRPREHEDLIELAERHGIRYAYVRSPSFDLNTADGRQVARMLAAQDAAESERIGERVTRARRQQAEQGRYGGGKRPYGFEPDGITRREAECQVVADAAYAIARGATLRGLARDLRTRQVPTVTGRAAWSAQTLRDILVRPRNAGRLVYRGEVVGTAGWEPIVPPDVHDRVVALLGDEKRDTRAGTAPRWLLSGLARCGICGSPVEITTGGRAPRYRCKAAPHLTRAQAHVDEFVTGVVLGWVRRDFPEVFVPARPEVDAAALRAERSAIEDNLTAMAADAAVDVTGRLRRQLRAANQRAEARLAEIDQELSAADGPDPDLVELATAADPMAVWNSLTLERQRMVVQATVVVTIEPVGRRGRGFDPDSIRIEPAAA